MVILATYKPMARARRVSLFHREIRETLSSAAIEILLGQADLLSEGQIADGEFYGSTMITVDCRNALDWVTDPCDATTARQLGELMVNDERFRDRARAISEREAIRSARVELGLMQVEMKVSTEGNNLHIDVDVQATPVPTSNPKKLVSQA